MEGILVQGTGKMVQLSEGLSYWRFKLSSDFNERVLVKVQGKYKNSLSYWNFELLGLWEIGIPLNIDIVISEIIMKNPFLVSINFKSKIALTGLKSNPLWNF